MPLDARNNKIYDVGACSRTFSEKIINLITSLDYTLLSDETKLFYLQTILLRNLSHRTSLFHLKCLWYGLLIKLGIWNWFLWKNPRNIAKLNQSTSVKCLKYWPTFVVDSKKGSNPPWGSVVVPWYSLGSRLQGSRVQVPVIPFLLSNKRTWVISLRLW